jgi:hypothetical protein
MGAVNDAQRNKHVAAFEARHIQPGETVAEWVLGSLPDVPYVGALIVTNKRVAFYRKGFFGELLQTMPLRSVTSVERATGLMMRNTLRIHTSNDDLTIHFRGDATAVASAIELGRERLQQ